MPPPPPIDSMVQEDMASDNDAKISLHTLTGIKMTDTMYLATVITSTSLRALVDSGSRCG